MPCFPSSAAAHDDRSLCIRVDSFVCMRACPDVSYLQPREDPDSCRNQSTSAFANRSSSPSVNIFPIASGNPTGIRFSPQAHVNQTPEIHSGPFVLPRCPTLPLQIWYVCFTLVTCSHAVAVQGKLRLSIMLSTLDVRMYVCT